MIRISAMTRLSGAYATSLRARQRRAPKPRTDRARAAYDWNDIPIPPEGRACGRGLHSFARRPHLLLAGVVGIAGVSSLRLQSPDHRWPFQHTVWAASAGHDISC